MISFATSSKLLVAERRARQGCRGETLRTEKRSLDLLVCVAEMLPKR